MRARRRALAVERSAASGAPDMPSAADRARERTRTILADPVFRHVHAAERRRPTSLVGRFVDWLGRTLAHLIATIFRHTRVTRETGNALGYALLLGAAVLLAAVVARLVARAAGTANAPRSAAGGEAAESDPIVSADAAARAGDFTRACTQAFRAALRRLDRDGIVPFDPARTPGEYRRALRRTRAALDEPFAVVARAYVLAVFGERAPDAAGWAQVRAAYESLCGAERAA